MKKFILLTLLASGLSAHAVGQASEQINTNQNEDSDEELNKAIELSLVDQAIEEEKKREKALNLSANTQKNNPVGEMQIDTFQRNVQQSNSGFAEDCEEEAIRKAIEKENEEAIEKISKTLTPEEGKLNFQNQRSVFKGEEVAPAGAAPGGAQEVQIETRFNLVSNPIATAEGDQIDTATQQIASFSDKRERILQSAEKKFQQCLKDDEYGTQVEQVEQSDPLKTITDFLYTKEASVLTSQLNKFNRERFNKMHSHLQIQPVISLNHAMTRKMFDKSMSDIIQEIIRRKKGNNPVQRVVFGPDMKLERNSLSLRNILRLNGIFKLKGAQVPIKVRAIADSWDTFSKTFLSNNPNNLPMVQWAKEHCGIDDIMLSFTIAQAHVLGSLAPGKVGMIVVDSWQNFWTTFLNNNPNNLPFDQWRTAYFGTVSPKKFKLTTTDVSGLDLRYVYWGEGRPENIETKMGDFFRTHRDQLSLDNFEIALCGEDDVRRFVSPPEMRNFFGDTELLKYVTGIKGLTDEGREGEILEDNIKICLRNNKDSITTLIFRNGYMGRERALAWAPFIATLNLNDLLLLENCEMNNFEMKVIMDALTNSQNLRQITMADNNADDEIAKTIVDALQNSPKLSYLILCGNHFGDRGAMAFVPLVQNSSNLELLDFSNNRIGDVGARALVRAVLDSKINDEIALLLRNNNNITEDCKTELNKLCNTSAIDLELVL